MSRSWLVVALLAAALPVALPGCVTEQNIAQKSVNIYCARSEECDKGAFETAYTSQTDCVETLVDGAEEIADCSAQWCTFNAEAAGNCLAGARQVGCDDWSQANYDPDCDEIYTDCDMVNLTLCYVT